MGRDKSLHQIVSTHILCLRHIQSSISYCTGLKMYLSSKYQFFKRTNPVRNKMWLATPLNRTHSVPDGTGQILTSNCFYPYFVPTAHSIFNFILYWFENVSFIVRDFKFFKKFEILFRKRFFTMMNFLIFYVINNIIDMRFAV